jgi:hypothetical protein
MDFKQLPDLFSLFSRMYTAEFPEGSVRADFRGPSSGRREVVFWIAHTSFWLAAFAAGMILIRAFKPAVEGPIWVVGCRVVCGAVVSALLRWLSLHDDVLRRLGISKAGLMIGGPLLGAVMITILLAGFGPRGDEPFVRLGLAAWFVLNGTVLATWSAVYFGYQLLRERQLTDMRALEAESLAHRNELRHLQSQISPHFLFNALNTILACKDDPDAIEAVTQALAKYLRYLLEPSDTLEPLGREIDALEEYLTIQSIRFGDRLVCRIDCDADIRRIPVLPVMIQPLVENALKYGAYAGDQPLHIEVRAHRQANWLFVEVANNGRWIAPDPAASLSTGLHTLRRRLLLKGGPDARVTTSAAEGWVRVVIQIPLTREYAADRAEAETTS